MDAILTTIPWSNLGACTVVIIGGVIYDGEEGL